MLWVLKSNEYHNISFVEENEKFQYFLVVVCVEVLRPSQPNRGHVERGQFT